MTDTDATRMVALEHDVSEDADTATSILLLHPKWAPTLDPVRTKLLAARDLLHDFNNGTPVT
jgi:hypothetical protein